MTLPEIEITWQSAGNWSKGRKWEGTQSRIKISGIARIHLCQVRLGQSGCHTNCSSKAVIHISL